MKGQIVYVKGHEDSERQADVAFKSFKKHGYDVQLVEGITPSTIANYSKYEVLKGSRLDSFLWNDNNLRKFTVKKSCAINNVEFAKKVVEADQPMMFLEHDAKCILHADIDFDEYCFLGIQTWNKPPSPLGLNKFRKYNPIYRIGVHDFPANWPLKYHKETVYKGANLTPGTIAYALSPKGAKKILHAVNKHGLEQSDFMINSSVIRLQYIYPAIVEHQPENLNLSHRL